MFKLSLPYLHINNIPISYVDSVNSLCCTFADAHKDHNDILRQMRTLSDRSNRLLGIFHGCYTKVLIELGRSYCGWFYCSFLWKQFNKSTISNILVAYNDLYRKISQVSRRSGAGEMFVQNNIPNFESLLRKETFSFTSILKCSSNAIISTIESCWILKYVIWKPWHIDRLFIYFFFIPIALDTSNLYIDKICNIFYIFIVFIIFSIYMTNYYFLPCFFLIPIIYS